MLGGFDVCILGNLLEVGTTLAVNHRRVFLPILFIVLPHTFLLGLLRTTKVYFVHLCISRDRNISV